MPENDKPPRRGYPIGRPAGRPMGVPDSTTRARLRKEVIAARKMSNLYAGAKIVADRRRGRKRAYWRVIGAKPVPLHDEVEQVLKKLRCIRCDKQNVITLGEIDEEQVSGSARCAGCELLCIWSWQDTSLVEAFKAWSSTHKRGGVPVEIPLTND